MMRVRSFAKINLGLEIRLRRSDGYHNIRTLFQSIELHDVLTFSPDVKGRTSLTGTNPSISWGRDNLICQAVKLLRQYTGCNAGISIDAEKKIPPGGGLAGGSSNAAATLWALNRIWDLDLSRTQLIGLGRRLGSDVPYFFFGGLCLGSRRGDRVRELSDLKPLDCMLVYENFPITTAAVYQHLTSTLTSQGKESKIIKFLKDRRVQGLYNDLEDAVFDLFPQVRKHKMRLLDAGALLALVSGSGSTVFGMFPSLEAAESARDKLDLRTQLTKTLARREYRKKLFIED